MGLAAWLWSCAGSADVAAPPTEGTKSAKAVPASPEQVSAWRAEGLLRLEAGAHAEASELLRKAFAATPADGLLALSLGEAALLAGNASLGQQALREATRLLPENPRAQLLSAIAETNGGDPSRRETAKKRAVELKAEAFAVLLDEADALDRAGSRLTIDALTLAVEISPKDVRANVRLAEAYRAAGATKEAARALETAAKAAAKSAPLFRQASDLWKEAGELEKAAELRKEADALDPPPPKRKLRPLPESPK